ncbi:MAG: hypothetical protein WBA29_02690 [Xanthobacteraceae bacterium]
MRVPMPSPRGTNVEKLYIDWPLNGAAYDEKLPADAAAALLTFLTPKLTEEDLAEFCRLAGIDRGMSMDRRRRYAADGKLRMPVADYVRATAFLSHRLTARDYDFASKRLAVDAAVVARRSRRVTSHPSESTQHDSLQSALRGQMGQDARIFAESEMYSVQAKRQALDTRSPTSADAKSFAERFPHAARIKVSY